MDCIPNSNNSAAPEPTSDCKLFDLVLYTAILGTIIVLGIIGNSIAFFVLWKDAGKTSTSFLLRCMAVTDTLVLLLAIPVYALPQINDSYKELYPLMLPYLWPCYQIPYTGTILLTVLVSVNRYIAVCKPYSRMKSYFNQNVRQHVICIAVFSIIYNIPRFFEYEKRVECDPSTNKTMTSVALGGVLGNSLAYRIIYTNILYFVVMHGGPLLLLSFLNAQLIRALKERQTKRREMGQADVQQDITLVLIVVICSFLCCQTPTFLDYILWVALPIHLRATCPNWHYYYTAIADSLGILNSSVNFLIYVLTSRTFRLVLKNACTGAKEDASSFVTLGERGEATQASPANHMVQLLEESDASANGVVTASSRV